MKKNTLSILNDPALLAKKEELFGTLADFAAGKRFDRTVNLNGIVFFPPGVDAYLDPEGWVDAALGFAAEHASRIADADILRPLAIEFGFYGVHFVDKILGANVYMLDGQWANDYLTTQIGTLKAPDLASDKTFLLAKRLAERFVAADVKLPVFGMPTIASALNIAVNLYGEEAFLAFYENEEGIRHDLRVINDTLLALHNFYLRTIPFEQLQPVVSWERTQGYGCGQLCGCSTQMISAGQYADFCMPLDNEILELYKNPGMIHLCGSHTQHIKSFAAMPHLKALQLHNRAAQDLALYLDGLRADQIVYLNVCEEMPYDEAYRISGGDRVIFVGEFAPKVKGES